MSLAVCDLFRRDCMVDIFHCMSSQPLLLHVQSPSQKSALRYLSFDCIIESCAVLCTLNTSFDIEHKPIISILNTFVYPFLFMILDNIFNACVCLLTLPIFCKTSALYILFHVLHSTIF